MLFMFLLFVFTTFYNCILLYSARPWKTTRASATKWSGRGSGCWMSRQRPIFCTCILCALGAACVAHESASWHWPGLHRGGTWRSHMADARRSPCMSAPRATASKGTRSAMRTTSGMLIARGGGGRADLGGRGGWRGTPCATHPRRAFRRCVPCVCGTWRAETRVARSGAAAGGARAGGVPRAQREAEPVG